MQTQRTFISAPQYPTHAPASSSINGSAGRCRHEAVWILRIVRRAVLVGWMDGRGA